MMKIANVKITDVVMGFDDRDRFAVKMEFNGQGSGCYGKFFLTDPIHVQRLIKLMNYTDAIELKDLNGKIIRKVDLNRCMHAFGHSIEDTFVPIYTDEFTEISEAELETMATIFRLRILIGTLILLMVMSSVLVGLCFHKVATYHCTT